MTLQIDDQVVGNWLSKPLWPWPLALAYSQPSKVRVGAIRAAVEILELYPKIGGESAKYEGIAAVGRVYEAVVGSEAVVPAAVELMALEDHLWKAIHLGACAVLGRTIPDGPLDPLRPEDIPGREVSPEKKCDLVTAGWAKSGREMGAMRSDVERKVWFYDLHLRRDEVRSAFKDAPAASLQNADGSPRLRRPFNGRRPTAAQVTAFDFFKKAAQFMPDGSRSLSQTELFATYQAAFMPAGEKAAALNGQQLGFTQFKSALRYHALGNRIERGRWQLTE